MAYADTKAAILAHAVAAGATLTPPIIDVKIALPLPKGRCIRVYYGGETEPRKMGGNLTLNSEMVGKVTIISAFWPITSLSEDLAAAIDADMEALTHQMRTRINGDADLGGTETDVTLEYAEPDLVISGNTRYAMVRWNVIGDYIEYPRTP